ncbi:MAG: winged helix-turn-helix domain-containing tetratricopeptide repeat protein [Terriglobia bacterium]
MRADPIPLARFAVSESVTEPARLRFGIFELDLITGELRKAGSLVRLPPQPFKILALLASRPGQLLSREEIQKEIWGDDTFVDFEQGLNFAIKKIRDALGDDAESPRYLQTLPRRGYRFIASVETTPPPAAVASVANDGQAAAPEKAPAPHEPEASAEAGTAQPAQLEPAPILAQEPSAGAEALPHEQPMSKPSRRLGWVVPVIAVAGALTLLVGLNVGGLKERLGLKPASPRIESIAVLPFVNASGDPDSEYLADGLTEGLINRLSEIPKLTVMSRGSVLRYKGQEPGPQAVARDLRVHAVLAGRVVRRGDDIRISTELIDARDGRHVWGEQYHRRLGELIEINGEMAGAISRQLRLTLTPQAERSLGKRHTASAEAYQEYLRGVTLLGSYRPGGAAAAIKYLREATVIDPQFALAYASLATAYVQASQPAEARPPAEKALALDDSLGEAHRALAMIKCWLDWDWAGCEREFQRAIELNPNDSHAHHYYSHFLQGRRRFDESMVQSLRALELDPLSPALNTHLGTEYLATEKYDLAIERLERAIELDPNFSSAHQFLGEAYIGKGMTKEAVAEFLKEAALTGETPENVAELQHAFENSGLKGYRLKKLELAKARWQKSHDNQRTIASLYAALDQKDQALAWLEKGFEERAVWLMWLESDPAFAPVRSDPRFQDLLRRMNFPE